MTTLVVIPTRSEFDAFVNAIATEPPRKMVNGLVPTFHLPLLDISIALGGLGKVQFAVSCQHLLDQRPWSALLCVGAAGGLAAHIKHGDLVASTETIEHDIRKLARPLMPRYQSDTTLLQACRDSIAKHNFQFEVHFGPVASGDEDIADTTTRDALAARTGALAVAWEGAGAGAACQFSKVPFLELRGIADSADPHAPEAFARNINQVMANLAAIVRTITAGSA